MRIKTILITCLLIFINLSVFAQQDGTDSLRRAFGKEPVPSTKGTATPDADTLETGNPAVKVILFSNHTWRYIKDPKLSADDKVFTEAWDQKSTDPYRESTLPESVTLWIVDTLDSYCCPNQTTPSSKFGYRHGRAHTGIDLPFPKGTPVYAAFDGKVRISDYVGGYGNLVIIRHANGLETFYGHLSESRVNPGDWVNAGDTIGLGGSTGRSSGPHLHFETRYKGHAFDPAWLIEFKTGARRHRRFRLTSKYFNPHSRYIQTEEDEDEINLADEKDRVEAEEKAKKEAAAREAAALAAIKYHTVRKGDTLSGIAARYHTSVRTLCRLNGISETKTLQIGQKIRVK